jgi:hypothetical protein
MLTYAKCNELMRSAKSPEKGKPLANNTRLIQRGDSYAVRLHSTDILEIRPDDSFIYDSGGWRTHTTKERMNDYGPLLIYQRKGEWFAGDYIYADRMTVKPDGSVMGAASKAELVERAKLAKRIASYSKRYIAALYAGEVPVPSNGDCWHCLMRTADGKTLGEVSSTDHLTSHMDENYYVPSLLVTALERQGASIAEMQTMQAYMQGKPEHAFPGDFLREQMQRHLTKYIRGQFRLAN